MLTIEDLKQKEKIRTYIAKADESLIALGFTEHSFAHVTNVAANAKYILETLGYPQHDIELVQVAAYLHDIGNLVNRVDHSQSGAVMAFRILDDLGMDPAEVATVVSAIGNHDEGTGVPVDTHYSSVMDYFEIFLGRMTMCRRAAESLGLQFKLIINEQPLM